MSKHTRNKVSYNIDEALNYLLESDEEDLGQLEDDNCCISQKKGMTTKQFGRVKRQLLLL